SAEASAELDVEVGGAEGGALPGYAHGEALGRARGRDSGPIVSGQARCEIRPRAFLGTPPTGEGQGRLRSRPLNSHPLLLCGHRPVPGAGLGGSLTFAGGARAQGALSRRSMADFGWSGLGSTR